MHSKTLTKKLLMQATVMAAPLLLVGCSSVPDAVNPVEWYRSSVEYFSSDEPATSDAEKTAESKTEMAQADTAQPVSEKKEVPSGFVAAQTPQRQYAEPVMRQGDIVNPLSDAQKVDVAAPPAPKAAPSTPVTTQPITQTEPAKPTVTAQAPALVPPSSPVSSITRPAANTDKRSINEIYAANLAQTRPTQTVGGANVMQSPMMGGQMFETVVVSSSGVSRQGATGYAAPQPLQYASLTQTMQTDARDTMSSAMMAEPGVVQQGQAMSLNRYNPGMYNGSFQVATIQFGNGSAHLTPEDVRILREVINIHRQQGGVIRVVGHASSRTRNMVPEKHMAVNNKMSLARADTVGRELLKLGMPGDRLFVGGLSDTQPLYQEVMPSGEAGNRRTEIYVDY